MIIDIPLGGEIRKIKWDGIQFRPLNRSGIALAYCTKFGNAVTYLVKDVANTDELVNKQIKEDTITLVQFVNRFERILNDIKNLTPEDFNVQLPEPEQTGVTIRKPAYPKAPIEEEEDIDGL